MSHQASHWAIDQTCATSTEKAILLVLANYVGADGTCFPGQDTLARQACCSVKSVERALQAFEGRGWLIRTARRRKDGSRTSDLLELTLAPKPESPEQADTVSGGSEPTRHPVQTNPTFCPDQPDLLSGPTTFEPVRGTKTSEANASSVARAGNDNTKSTPVARQKASKFVPDSWAPTTAHIAKAEELGLDVHAEAESFRLHEFKDPKSNFDLAFHRWLRNAKGFAPQAANQNRPGGRRDWDPMDQAFDGIQWPTETKETAA